VRLQRCGAAAVSGDLRFVRPVVDQDEETIGLEIMSNAGKQHVELQ